MSVRQKVYAQSAFRKASDTYYNVNTILQLDSINIIVLTTTKYL